MGGVRVRILSSFSYPVGNQDCRDLSQVRGGQGSEEALTKAVGSGLHLSFVTLSVVWCLQTAFVTCMVLGGCRPRPGWLMTRVRDKSSEDASCQRACGGSFFALHNEHFILPINWEEREDQVWRKWMKKESFSYLPDGPGDAQSAGWEATP